MDVTYFFFDCVCQLPVVLLRLLSESFKKSMYYGIGGLDFKIHVLHE